MRRRNAILLQIYEYYGQQPIKTTNFYLCCRFFIVGKTPYEIITSYHPFAVPATPKTRQKAYGDIRVACCGKQRIYAAACQRHLKAEEPSPHVSRKVKMREWRLSDRNVGKRMSHSLRSLTTLPERLFRASGKALPGLGKASPARRKRLYRKTKEALRQTECVRGYTP